MKSRILMRLIVYFVLFVGLSPTIQTASATTFELVAPPPIIKIYQYPTEYKLFTGDGITMFPSAPGDVTAPVQFVGYGNTDAYYAGFAPGNIALIERGGIVGDTYFSTKVNLADAHGAVGAIVFDNSSSYQPVGHAVPTFIPSIFTTDDVGAELLNYLRAGIVTAHISTSVPEPTTLLLLGLGLMGIVGVRRFKK